MADAMIPRDINEVERDRLEALCEAIAPRQWHFSETGETLVSEPIALSNLPIMAPQGKGIKQGFQLKLAQGGCGALPTGQLRQWSAIKTLLGKMGIGACMEAEGESVVFRFTPGDIQKLDMSKLAVPRLAEEHWVKTNIEDVLEAERLLHLMADHSVPQPVNRPLSEAGIAMQFETLRMVSPELYNARTDIQRHLTSNAAAHTMKAFTQLGIVPRLSFDEKSVTFFFSARQLMALQSKNVRLPEFINEYLRNLPAEALQDIPPQRSGLSQAR